MKTNVSILLLLSLMSLSDAIKVNEQMKSHSSVQTKLKQKSALEQKTGLKSHQQLLVEVMQRDDKSKSGNGAAPSSGLLSVTEASYLDAQMLSGVDEDNVVPVVDAAASDAASTDAKDAGTPAESGGGAGGAAANSTADAGGSKKAGDDNDGNRIDDEVQDQTRAWTNEHYGIKNINETDPVYGHKVFKDEMNRFLPYHTQKPPNRRWSYGWHLDDIETDHKNDWDKDLNKGGDKATEGYYPSDEDDEEKTWSRREQKYSNYGPWNYRWGYNFWRNGGYNGNPNAYGGRPGAYPYGMNSGYEFGQVGEPKRNPDGTLKEEPKEGESGDPEKNAQDIQSTVQVDAAQSQTDKYTRDESGTGAEGDVDADWY